MNRRILRNILIFKFKSNFFQLLRESSHISQIIPQIPHVQYSPELGNKISRNVQLSPLIFHIKLNFKIEKSEEQWVKSEVYPPNFSLPVWKQRLKSQVTPLIWTCLLWGTKMDQKLPEEPEGKILMSVPGVANESRAG